jgi:hypothetical protein
LSDIENLSQNIDIDKRAMFEKETYNFKLHKILFKSLFSKNGGVIKGGLREVLDDALDPVKNGFKVISIEEFNFSENDNFEVWTDGVSVIESVQSLTFE